MPTFDELSAKVAELTSQVSFLQSTLNPVDETGLPLPTSKKRDRADKHYGRTDIEGPRWQVDTSWTVIAMEDPDDAHCVFIRDHYGQQTGDVCSMSVGQAIKVAGALLAAVRYNTDELARRRVAPRSA